MSVEYYKKQNEKLKKEKTYAWGMYFKIRNEAFEIQEAIYDEIHENIREDNPELFWCDSEHLQKFITGLYKTAKVSIECPICIERIDAETLDTTKCGHNFHKDCMNTLKENRPVGSKFVDCPMCRTQIWAIKNT